MLSMSEKHTWLIQVKDVAPEMQRISWLGKKKWTVASIAIMRKDS